MGVFVGDVVVVLFNPRVQVEVLVPDTVVSMHVMVYSVPDRPVKTPESDPNQHNPDKGLTPTR
jgi:hypothetical protein